MNTGIYGTKHQNHKINVSRKFVAKHLERNVEAIAKLIFEDRNIYIENDKHDQINLLNKFLEAKRKSMDFETFKNLKESIGFFVNSNNKK